MMKSFPHFKQLDRTDCSATTLRMIAKFYGKNVSGHWLREKCHISAQGTSITTLSDAAEAIGFRTIIVKINLETLLNKCPLPCVVYWRDRHFMVVYGYKKGKVLVADPSYKKVKFTKEEFEKAWVGKNETTGYAMMLEPGPDFYTKEIEQEEGSKTLGLSFAKKYLKGKHKVISNIVLSILFATLLQVIFPFLTQSIVDKGIRNNNLNFINLILLAQLFLFASQTLMEVIRNKLTLVLSNKVNISIVSDYIVKVLSMPLSFFYSKRMGDLLQRLEDNRIVERFLTQNLLTFSYSAFTMVVFSFILLYYNSFIFIIFLLATVINFSWIISLSKKRSEIEYKRRDEDAANRNVVIQLFEGIQEIKLNNSHKKRRWKWEELQYRTFNTINRALSVTNLQVSGSRFLNELKNILVTFVAAKSVVNGEITLGMMLSTQYIIGQLNRPANDMVQFIRGLQDVKISLTRLSEVHNTKPEAKSNAILTTTHADISIENLCFRYAGKRSALILDDISFKVPKSKITAVVGTSGSGKTTLLKLLLKLHDPSEGSIRVGDSDLSRLETENWRSHCGVVMQDGFIFTDSILNNITESETGERIDYDRLYNAIELSNLEGLIKKLPKGMETRIGPYGIQLSGGEKQRVLLARAIYKDPDYLFLDEATSALDANNEKEIMEKLNKFFQGKTVFIIAHRLSTVKKADNLIVLEQGKIVEQGTHNELLALEGKYFHLVKDQLELGN